MDHESAVRELERLHAESMEWLTDATNRVPVDIVARVSSLLLDAYTWTHAALQHLSNRTDEAADIQRKYRVLGYIGSADQAFLLVPMK